MNALDPARFYLGDKVAWDGSRLVVTDPDLLSRLDKPYLSASTAKSLHGCQARWVGEKALPDAFDLFSATEKGSAAHLVLEVLYQLPAARRDPKHAAAILTDLPRRDPAEGEVDYGQALGTDPVRYTQWLTMVTSAYQGIFDIEKPSEVEVYKTELRLDGIEVGSVPFKGFIDRVDVLDNGALGVRDYKTGKDKSKPNPRFDDDHGDQIRLYVAALRRWLRERGEEREVGDGQLFYIEHGTLRVVDIGASAMRKTVAGFVDSWRIMKRSTESATFEANPSPLCGWCPLVMACPVARPARKPNDPRNDPAKQDSLLQAVDLGIPRLRKTRTAPAAAEAPATDSGADQFQAAAAHTAAGQDTSGTSIRTREDEMGTSRPWREVKAWDTDGGRVDGHLMMAAPHATAVIGLVSLAAEQVNKYGLKLGPGNLRPMAALLAKVVLDAQATITNGSADWGEGANTRARGALHTVLDLIPLPFPPAGEGRHDVTVWAEHADDLLAWQNRATNFVVAIIRTGIDLFEGNLPVDFRATVPAPSTAQGAAA